MTAPVPTGRPLLLVTAHGTAALALPRYQQVLKLALACYQESEPLTGTDFLAERLSAGQGYLGVAAIDQHQALGLAELFLRADAPRMHELKLAVWRGRNSGLFAVLAGYALDVGFNLNQSSEVYYWCKPDQQIDRISAKLGLRQQHASKRAGEQIIQYVISEREWIAGVKQELERSQGRYDIQRESLVSRD